MASGDLVGTWNVSLSEGKYKIEFEHGTTSGRRVIRVNGKEIYREDWMFKLVGKEHFTVGKTKCSVSIDAVQGFQYEYTLTVNGKSLQKFKDNQSKIMKCWIVPCGSQGSTPYRVVLEKDTQDVYVDGKVVESTGEFTEEGVETHFAIGNAHSAYIKALSSGKRRTGLIHTLFISEGTGEDKLIPESNECR